MLFSKHLFVDTVGPRDEDAKPSTGDGAWGIRAKVNQEHIAMNKQLSIIEVVII